MQRAGLVAVLASLGAESLVAESWNELQLLLHQRLAPMLLIGDVRVLLEADRTVWAQAISLAVLAPDRHVAQALDERIAGVLIWPVERRQMADLLMTIRAGGTYRPTVVREQYLLTVVPLRAREEDVVGLRLAGCSVEAAAAAMGVTVATILRYERRILERVDVLDPAERPAWVHVLERKR